MPNLQDLPSELLTVIIKDVICTQREPPAQIIPGLDRAERLGPNRRFQGIRPDVWYETDQKAYRTTAYGLLSTNKKINEETNAVLKTVVPIYKLDVCFYGRALWPTWTFLPKKTNNVEMLKITFGARGPGKACFRKLWNLRGETSFVEWMFYELFEKLLEFSVQGPPKHGRVDYMDRSSPFDLPYDPSSKMEHTNVTIKVLDIDCVEPARSYLEPSPEGTEVEECVHCGMCCESIWRSKYHPHHLRAVDIYDMLKTWIYSLMTRQGFLCADRFFYASIGMIKLREDGVLRREIDLTEWLLKLPDMLGDEDMSQWRMETIRHKKDRGFDMSKEVQRYVSAIRMLVEVLEARDGRPLGTQGAELVV